MKKLAIGACAVAVGGTLLSLSRRNHWIFRMWDFPRVQIATLAAGGALMYSRYFHGRPYDYAVIVPAAAVVAWQLGRIGTYTPLASRTVRRAARRDENNRITLLITNVLMENDRHERLLQTIERENPDVILAVETDAKWEAALDALRERYPHSIRDVRDNYYGMMLFSRLELVEPRVDYLIQDDIPSIHTRVKLRSGVEVALHGLHPRPPEPIRDQPSSPRDAELVVVGRAIGGGPPIPTIVAGDLNDVAWSPTSQLFVRLSGLLDPRAGRGFYNSYNANNPLLRYPLDHVFLSKHFELVRLRRLPSIGSDHFPILIELQYNEDAARVQEESHEKPGDQAFADEKLAQEAHDAATGADRPS